ncbi:MAG: HAMP domain-containing histidine kinase [Actinobacteria bacterium]|nr:HAMP domain-containing histidine kinase [Actinomycetota bacterium]
MSTEHDIWVEDTTHETHPAEGGSAQFVDPSAGPHAPSVPPTDGIAALATDPPSAPTTGRRWQFLPRRLVSRLVLGVTTLVIVVVASTGYITYLKLHSFLMDRLDQQLATTANNNSGLNRLFTGDNSPVPFRSVDVWAVQLDPSGAVLTQPTNAMAFPLQLSAADRASLATSTTSTGASSPARTITTTDGRQLRVVTRPGRVISTGQDVVVVIGLSTDDVTNTLHQLFVYELVIGGIAVALAILATSGGVQLSLRGLRRVAATARSVSAELSPQGAGLDRRVPVTDAERHTEVGEVAESMNTMLGAVELQFAARVESEQRMRQFLADASHELRTPLTSIRGYAELARMRRSIAGESASPNDDADALERIEAEGTRMSRLVDDLLTLARSDRGAPIQHELVDIDEVIDTAVDGVRAAHPTRPIEALVEPGIEVMGDFGQLLRIVRNLLTNAAVHTRADAPIRVTADRAAGWAQLQVIDSGPGLAPEQVAHVFERFWRSDASRARTSGGSGLGLSIVASIVEAHGGHIRFDSSVETGSTVSVYLPLVQTAD